MKKFLIVLLVLGTFAVLLAVGRYWNLRPDTAERHVVHKGEVAVLIPLGSAQVWLAHDKRHCYSLQVSMTNNDTAALKNSEARGESFPVPTGAQVKVVDESVSARKIEFVDGPLAGRSGWVEFEYLRPRRAGEFQ
jgi:hypothetical protein